MQQILIHETNNIIEYKNFYFARIAAVVLDGVIYGYRYTDKSTMPENTVWYAMFFSMKLEDTIMLPDGCHFGEDCIYAQNIDQVAQLCETISTMEIRKQFPLLSDMKEEFDKELYF